MSRNPKQGQAKAKPVQRRLSLFRVVCPPSSGIRQVADNFFTTQLHYLEQETFMENSAQLRNIVAFVTFVFGKNNEHLVESALPNPDLRESSEDASSQKLKRKASLARRGSLDMRRMKLIETDANKDALPKGVPSM